MINGQELIRVSVHHRYVDEVYEPEVFELLRREIRKDDIIIDVGAYIGVYSIILSRHLGAHGKIYAFEPAPESAELLLKHLTLNNAREKVEVLPHGISDKCGRAKFFVIGDHIQNSFSSVALGKDAKSATIDVSIVSLDAFCAERSIQPNWVKVDTEGWELPVLRGAVGLLATNKSMRFIVEMHPYAWQSAGYDARIFRRFCVEHFLQVDPLSGQSDAFAEYGQVLISVGT
jgi:FkbM family methyltransferase